MVVVLALLLLGLAWSWLLKRYWWIDLLDGADADQLKRAQALADKSKNGILPKLPFSEGNIAWILLYDHARTGQIDPKVMWHIRRSDLEYLAGMNFPHPDLENLEPKSTAEKRHAELTKLQGNVSRAAQQLAFRNLILATAITASAALIGAIIGVAFAK